MSQSIRRAMYRAKGLPDPGPTPSVDMTQLTILVPRSIAKALDDVHEFVSKDFPSRNDFLEEILKEGLRSAIQAQKEALEALAAREAEEAKPAIEVDDARPKEVIVNPALEPAERERISARLRALRGESVAVAPRAQERAGNPMKGVAQ